MLKKQECLKIEENKEECGGVIVNRSKVNSRESLDPFYKWIKTLNPKGGGRHIKVKVNALTLNHHVLLIFINNKFSF